MRRQPRYVLPSTRRSREGLGSCPSSRWSVAPRQQEYVRMECTKPRLRTELRYTHRPESAMLCGDSRRSSECFCQSQTNLSSRADVRRDANENETALPEPHKRPMDMIRPPLGETIL